MFTGIIEAVGTVRELRREAGKLAVAIEVPFTAGLGDSVAIDGCCLTVTHNQGPLWFDVAEESLRRTSLSEIAVGSKVQVERAMRADGRLDGHIVQGHVDGVATVKSKRPDGDATWLELQVPGGLTRYMVEKGAVALDGMSLTLTTVGADSCAVMLVPYTLAHTQLGHKPVGAKVNVEVDVLAKYVEKLVQR